MLRKKFDDIKHNWRCSLKSCCCGVDCIQLITCWLTWVALKSILSSHGSVHHDIIQYNQKRNFFVKGIILGIQQQKSLPMVSVVLAENETTIAWAVHYTAGPNVPIQFCRLKRENQHMAISNIVLAFGEYKIGTCPCNDHSWPPRLPKDTNTSASNLQSMWQWFHSTCVAASRGVIWKTPGACGWIPQQLIECIFSAVTLSLLHPLYRFTNMTPPMAAIPTPHGSHVLDWIAFNDTCPQRHISRLSQVGFPQLFMLYKRIIESSGVVKVWRLI